MMMPRDPAATIAVEEAVKAGAGAGVDGEREEARAAVRPDAAAGVWIGTGLPVATHDTRIARTVARNAV